jgi:hypothetical protein
VRSVGFDLPPANVLTVKLALLPNEETEHEEIEIQ